MSKTPSLAELEASLGDWCLDELDKFLFRAPTERFVVFDTETKLLDKNTNIFVTPPEFILGCVAFGSMSRRVISHDTSTSLEHQLFLSIGLTPRTFVGHNIGFDLVTTCGRNLHDTLSSPNVFLWDTAIAEYMIRGQSMKYPSLKDSLANWPGKVTATKDDKVGDAIRNGICPSTMDREELAKYCVADVEATRQLFLVQVKHLQTDMYLYRAVLNRMEWLRNTLIASSRGMQLDLNGVYDVTSSLNEEERDLYDELGNIMTRDLHGIKTLLKHRHPDSTAISIEVNPNSLQHVARYLYGGVEVPYEATVPTGELYKTGYNKGTPKFKTIRGTVPIPDVSVLGAVGATRTVTESDLQLYKKVSLDPVRSDFVDKLLKYRDIQKTRKTYFVGYSAFSDLDSKIHPVYNLTATPSGRLTCNKPNAQNMK